MGSTRIIRLGGIPIGGGNPISVQTMTKTDTRDVDATVGQLARIADAGCDIVRIAVPDEEAAAALPDILAAAGLPVVADIHFDYRLALASPAMWTPPSVSWPGLLMPVAISSGSPFRMKKRQLHCRISWPRPGYPLWRISTLITDLPLLP